MRWYNLLIGVHFGDGLRGEWLCQFHLGRGKIIRVMKPSIGNICQRLFLSKGGAGRRAGWPFLFGYYAPPGWIWPKGNEDREIHLEWIEGWEIQFKRKWIRHFELTSKRAKSQLSSQTSFQEESDQVNSIYEKKNQQKYEDETKLLLIVS